MSNRQHSSPSMGSSATLAPMPPPEPILEKFLGWALELLILPYVTLVKEITPEEILAKLNQDDARRAKIYHACTGMAEKFAINLDFERQADDIGMAIVIDEDVAQRFVEAVGIAYYVSEIPLSQIYHAVMETGWVIESKDTHREFAARLCEALVEHKAFHDSKSATYDNIFEAIGSDALMSERIPEGENTRVAELRSKMMDGLRSAWKIRAHGSFGEVVFSAVSFKDLASFVDVKDMAAPIAMFAKAHDLINAPGPSVAPPPPEEEGVSDADDAEQEVSLSEPPGAVVIVMDDEEVDDATREVSAEVADALAQIIEDGKSSTPPPLPPRTANSEG